MSATALIGTGLFALSEIIPLIPGLQANGVVHLLLNIGRWIGGLLGGSDPKLGGGA